MTETLGHYIPPEALHVLMVLALAILLGFERETRKVKGAGHYYFGGIATFPLLGLFGYGAAVLSKESLIPVGVGLAVIGGFLLISYRHKLEGSELSGFVTELTGLTAYLQGTLVFFQHYWLAATLVVINLIILELKKRLEVFSHKMPSEEIFTLARFLFLTAVILPIVPNEEFTQYKLNPFKIWTVVVVVCGLSYLAYLLKRFLKERGGVLIAAMIGGAYSSSAVTVTLSKHSRESHRAHLYTGAVWIACGLMCLRTVIFLAIFDLELMRAVLLPLIALGAGLVIAGFLWSRIPDPKGARGSNVDQWKNPLEILTALMFAGIFVVILIGNHLAVKYFGNQGVYYLAATAGSLDVDPFVLGLTQGQNFPTEIAAGAVLIALSGNNLVKAGYALIFGEKKMGRNTAMGLILAAAAGLTAILFF